MKMLYSLNIWILLMKDLFIIYCQVYSVFKEEQMSQMHMITFILQ